jgi:acid phosphatase (class A)
MNLMVRFKSQYLLSVALTLLLLVPTVPAAETSYLAPGKPDGVELLPPPPVPGSAEQDADMATARSVFHARTEAERKRAIMDSGLSFSLFAAAIGPDFDLEKLPKTKAMLENVKKDVQDPINQSKNYYQRKRPYQLDESLELGQPEPSFSYPSGHSTRGTVYAMLIAELFPEKKEPILTIGRDIGWDRVLIGKHFPTDIYAGRVLARAIVREMKKSPAFQHDFAEAKAEVEALHAAPALSGAGK